jgi:hypothetical protein
MRRLWMTAAMAMLGCSPAFAQVGGTSVPTPGIAATSPLGVLGALQPGTSVGPTGIPLGATELTSPGISPMLTDPTSVMALGTTCSGGDASPDPAASPASALTTAVDWRLAARWGPERHCQAVWHPARLPARHRRRRRHPRRQAARPSQAAAEARKYASPASSPSS